jgi:UDP-N-acetyl-D-glucosamine dehydrogenase
MTVDSLEQRIADRSAVVGVVGLGYVGVPLASRAVDCGYKVNGIDKYMDDERLDEVRELGMDASRDFGTLRDCDIILVCVPTPLLDGQQPDTSFIHEAAIDIAGCLGRGVSQRLVVLESTSYPGTTREIMLPIFEEKGHRVGEDVLLAFAPERVDPGTCPLPYQDIPRIVGGIDERSGATARAFYSTIVDEVVLVSSPEIAETAKLLENIFRAVNIALVNEMSLLCRRMDINIWEVIEAASTKPFGFMSFKPGPGLGGHCIPVDPFYLAWKAKKYDFYPEFIELAGKINRSMPFHVVDWVADVLNRAGKSISNSRVLVIGVAYKEKIGDVRESPALKAIALITQKGGEVVYHDPFVESVEVGGLEYSSARLDRDLLADCDCVLLVTAHPDIDYDLIASSGIPVVDTRNALGRGGN